MFIVSTTLLFWWYKDIFMPAEQEPQQTPFIIFPDVLFQDKIENQEVSYNLLDNIKKRLKKCNQSGSIPYVHTYLHGSINFVYDLIL